MSRTIQRFQTWELDGFGQIHGRWPIPKGQEPHNRVELFREDGLIVKIREFTEDSAKPMVRKPCFKNGHLAYTDYIDPTARLKGRNRYAYGKDGLLRAREERDPKGNLRFRVEIKCDDEGRFVQEKLHDNKGKLRERHVYEYAGGKLSKDTVYKGRAGDVLDGYFTFEHDAAGHVSKQTWHGPDGAERNAFSYTYDRFHRQVEMRVERDGAVASVARSEFDELGRRSTTEYTSGDGTKMGAETVTEDGRVHAEGVLPEPSTTGADRALIGGARMADVAGVGAEQMKALAMVAYSHFENGRYEEARSLYESLIALDANVPNHYAGLAAVQTEEGNLREALSTYDRALARRPEHRASLAGKGEAYLRLGEVEQALTAFEAVLGGDPPDDAVTQRCRGILMALSRAS